VHDPKSDGTLQRLPGGREIETAPSGPGSSLSTFVARTGEVVGGWLGRAVRYVRRLGRRLRDTLIADD